MRRRPVGEWNEENNAPEPVRWPPLPNTSLLREIVGAGITSSVDNIEMDFSALTATPSNTIIASGEAQPLHLRTDDTAGSLHYIDDNYDVSTRISLREDMNVEVDIQGNVPVTIRVDRNRYDIELLEDKIEIRRKFDDEGNDIRTHDEPASHNVLGSEDMLQQHSSE